MQQEVMASKYANSGESLVPRMISDRNSAAEFRTVRLVEKKRLANG